MHVAVNGTTLFFDVDGAKLVPDGRTMREKPTLIVLHGGPGHDHSIFKTGFSQLTDIAQIIYLDHRGNGRSVGSGKGSWNLNQWGDDVKGLCDASGSLVVSSTVRRSAVSWRRRTRPVFGTYPTLGPGGFTLRREHW
jgi:pimeloyl-ACP methyl ester carboxylesterase